MARQTKAQQTERAEAIAQLREWLKPGDTVYTILDHVSSSGMSRAIRVVVPYTREDGTIDHLHPNWAVGKALGLRHWKRQGREQDALVVGGCGMDMGFHLVNSLSQVLYGGRYRKLAEGEVWTPEVSYSDRPPAGYAWEGGYLCLGKGKCPSNYHVNHHDTIQCPAHCHWVRGTGWMVDNGDEPAYLCTTCHGEGRIANPEGSERWDLVHTDGYALRHRWL